MKKICLVLGIVTFVFSTAIGVYAKEHSAKKGSYTMKYDLTGTKNTAAGAYTSSNGATDVIAFVSMFSYKDNTVKNSTSGQQIGYISKTLASNNGNRFVSYHNLKDDSYKPIGTNLYLELK